MFCLKIITIVTIFFSPCVYSEVSKLCDSCCLPIRQRCLWCRISDGLDVHKWVVSYKFKRTGAKNWHNWHKDLLTNIEFEILWFSNLLHLVLFSILPNKVDILFSLGCWGKFNDFQNLHSLCSICWLLGSLLETSALGSSWHSNCTGWNFGACAPWNFRESFATNYSRSKLGKLIFNTIPRLYVL